MKRRRRPIDLSLGYYLNAERDDSVLSVHSNEKTLFQLPSLANQSQTVGPNQTCAEIVPEIISAKRDKISHSDAQEPRLSGPSDPMSVDRFLKATSKINPTRNYKQARKRKGIKKPIERSPGPGDRRVSSGRAGFPASPSQTADQSRTRHRPTTRVLSDYGINVESHPSHFALHRWQPTERARAASVDKRLDAGMFNSPFTMQNSSNMPRVAFLPASWNKARPQSSNRGKAPRQPPCAKLVPDTPRPALRFEPMEEHDKKLKMWVDGGSVRGTHKHM